jgi:hypothetical protein
MRLGIIGLLGLLKNDLQWSKNFVPNTTDGKLDPSHDFQEFVELFVAHEVQFLIVGGYALAAHGHPMNARSVQFPNSYTHV